MRVNVSRVIGWAIGGLWLGTPCLQAIELPPMTTQAAPVEAQSSTAPASVNALMVYGEDKFKMKAQKAVTALQKNINDPVASLLEMPVPAALAFSPGDEIFQQSLVNHRPRLHNERILKPVFLNPLPTGPFIKIKLGGLGKNVVNWKFVVTAPPEAGTVFRQEGKGENLPDMLTWDGRNNNRNFVLLPGKKYVGEFTGINSAGKKVLSQKVDCVAWAFYYDQGRDRTALIDTTRLFKSGSRNELSNLGKSLLGATADYVREGASDELKLMVYADTSETADGQGQILARYLSEILMMEPKQVNLQPRKLLNAGTGRVEIYFSRAR